MKKIYYTLLLISTFVLTLSIAACNNRKNEPETPTGKNNVDDNGETPVPKPIVNPWDGKGYTMLPQRTFGQNATTIIANEKKNNAKVTLESDESTVTDLGDERTIVFTGYTNPQLVARQYFFRNNALLEATEIIVPIDEVIHYEGGNSFSLNGVFKDWAQSVGYRKVSYNAREIILINEIEKQRMIVLPSSLPNNNTLFAEIHFLEKTSNSGGTTTDGPRVKLKEIPKSIVPLGEGTTLEEVKNAEASIGSKLEEEKNVAGYAYLRYNTTNNEVPYVVYLIKSNSTANVLTIVSLYTPYSDRVWDSDGKLYKYIIELLEKEGYKYDPREDHDQVIHHYFLKPYGNPENKEFYECLIKQDVLNEKAMTSFNYRITDVVAQ